MPITIGALSRQTGVHVETIRYYEKMGLLHAPQRSAAGYRLYDDTHRQTLVFIRKGRDLGFPIATIRALLDLFCHPAHSCQTADALLSEHLLEVEAKIDQLVRLRDVLRDLSHCQSDTVSQCRILDALAHENNAKSATT